jgi:type IV secretory pathway protease TraF
MEPTYFGGDWLLVRWFDSPPTNCQGDKLLSKIVVIEREERPGIFLVKRLQKSHNGIYWVEGDDPESSDSRSWGWIPANEIIGVVLLRFKKSKLSK